MDVNGLLNSLLGSSAPQVGASAKSPLSGLAGGAAAGGLVALLMGSKGTRKFMGKAATLGGMALVGGLAYKALQNWQASKTANGSTTTQPPSLADSIETVALAEPKSDPALELTLVKAMIAAAKSDGHIDATEQKYIFSEVDKLQLPLEQKALIFEELARDRTPQEIAHDVRSLEHKADVYLASCLACTPDNPKERGYLDELAKALELPAGLTNHLEAQARA